MRMPEGMSWAEAASIPNVFVTAHDALVTNAAAAPGEAVIVTAGISGVGTAAIQIARYHRRELRAWRPREPRPRPPRCAPSARTRSSTRARRAGRDAVLRATGERGVDVIIDHVGGPMLAG